MVDTPLLEQNFNPHSHKGSDVRTAKQSAVSVVNFNPHSHKVSDSAEFIEKYFSKDFNPHSHKGSDGMFA